MVINSQCLKRAKKTCEGIWRQLVFTVTVKPANALHLSLCLLLLSVLGCGKCCVRLPSTETLHKLTPAGVTCMVVPRNVCLLALGKSALAALPQTSSVS